MLSEANGADEEPDLRRLLMETDVKYSKQRLQR
jgi:hypothetical protein